MKIKKDIVDIQKYFIEDLIKKIKAFINDIDKTKIETILLSGSVARGDFYPGEFGGMVDLTVMRKLGSSITAEEIFGPDKKPDIPFHCVAKDNIGYQISFSDFIDYQSFQKFDEAKKYALLESIILFDENDLYKRELESINKIAIIDQNKELKNGIGYIGYLLSDYKKDRWYRRNAFVQMHENLNTAIRVATKCLFYINGKYAPAEDRRLYYSYSLEKLPDDYPELLVEMNMQRMDNEEDYFRRGKIFNEKVVKYIQRFV